MIARGAHGEWLDWAACREVDAESFFIQGEGQPSRENKMARRLCATCPVQVECLDLALLFESHGIWAGTMDDERKRMRNARRAAA